MTSVLLAPGAGYSTSTMPFRRHTQIPAPGTALLLMDGKSRMSECRQHTYVGRVDVCRPTAASPPYYTAQTRWVQGPILRNSIRKKGGGGRGCTAADILHAAVEV